MPVAMVRRMSRLKITIVPVTPFQQNCAVICDEAAARAVVVDPGGDVERIQEALESTGAVCERIVLTHGHIDHAGGAAALRDALGVPIEGPDRRDAFLLDGLEAQGLSYGVTGVRSVVPDRWLAEGDSVDLAGQGFTVRHCPGHTPGHIVLISADQTFAIVGDTLFSGSIGRTDFPYGDHAALIRGIRETLLSLPDETMFLCGHGPASTIGAERRGNPFLRD